MTDISRPALDGAALLADARDLLPELVALRRRIHAEPELGLDLPETQARIIEGLADLDLDVATGTGLSSVVAVIRGAAEGPTVLLRADMDALPMPEDTGLPYASTRPGVMHACGHDAHVAMLVGAARLLAARAHELRGTVKLVFQPGEEGHHGARFCLDEGLLDPPTPDVAFAIHITPNLPSGMVGTRPGPLMASADEFLITVRGRGGHASMPQMALDPVPVACELVGAFQTLVTRRVDAFDPAVLTVGRITAGTANNVIPETAEIHGTLRTVSERTRSLMHAGIERVARGVAAAHECEVEVQLVPGYPVTVNDDETVGQVQAVLAELLGDEQVVAMPVPVMGAEDWSYVLQRVPGAMVFLGVCPPEHRPQTAPACHSNRMLLDEEALATGAAAHAAVALSYLT
jgi:amidohydrolase